MDPTGPDKEDQEQPPWQLKEQRLSCIWAVVSHIKCVIGYQLGDGFQRLVSLGHYLVVGSGASASVFLSIAWRC